MEDNSLVTTEQKKVFFEKNKETIMKSAPNHMMLLIDPEGYAKGAIEELERQLSNTKSINRKNKLNSKISEWKLALETMAKINGDKSENIENKL